MDKKMKVLIGAGMFNWSETQRMVYIAEKLIRLGVEVMFIGEGKYDYLLNDLMCERATLKSDQQWFNPDRIKRMLNLDVYGNNYASCQEIDEVVSEEKQIIDNYRPDLILTGYRTTLSISAKLTKVPLAWCLSAVVSPMFFEQGLATIPEDKKINHYLSSIKTPELKEKYFAKFASMNALSNCKTSKEWNLCLRKYGLPEWKNDISIFEGDINYMSDAPELFKELETDNRNNKYLFCGPFCPRDEDMDMPDWYTEYKKGQRKTVLIMMGSSGTKEVLCKVLEELRDTDNDYFVATLSLLSEAEKSSYPSNFYFANSFPIRSVMKMIDACIIHGGQGTLYSVAFAGKPFVGIPMFNEQQYNLLNMTKKFNNGITLLKKELKDKKITTVLTTVLTEKIFSENAQHVANLFKKYWCDESQFAETVVANEIYKYIRSNT